jgi:hypothetical protein
VAAGIVLFGAWTSYGQENSEPYAPEATPFGLKQGMSAQQLGGQAVDIGGGMYKLTSVPSPHPGMEFYVAQVSPRTGLCYIKAVGKPVQTSGYGTELQSQFENMRDEISAAYGHPRTVDMLLSDSMWEGPRDWMAGLAERERLLFAHWTSESRATLGPHLTNVFVGASARPANPDMWWWSTTSTTNRSASRRPKTGCRRPASDRLQARASPVACSPPEPTS